MKNYSEILEAIKREAKTIIEAVELESNGTRDGDGYWHGSDPMAGTLQNLEQLAAKMKTLEAYARMAGLIQKT